MSDKFNAISERDAIIKFIQDYMAENGPHSPVVIGISGGKDSTITAALCVAALGKERVIGVQLPAGNQRDIDDSDRVFRELGIAKVNFNIGNVLNLMYAALSQSKYKDLKVPNTIVRYNTPPRVRMAYLYMLANQVSGRVACTCNLSESYVGYDTRWGDQCGDFAPLQCYTATEVIEIGKTLGLSERLLFKKPDDGMCGQTDEQRWGFTYEILDAYLRNPNGDFPSEIVDRIETMHQRAKFKIDGISIPMHPYYPGGKTLH